MKAETAGSILLDALKGFHADKLKMYGQVALRINPETYLMTGGNKLLAAITEDDIDICDISSGHLGEIFRARPNINAFVFGCTPNTVRVSTEFDSLPVALEDLAQLTGSSVQVLPDASPSAIINGIKDAKVCLIKGLGGIAVSSNVRRAVAEILVLEKSCEAQIYGDLLGGVKPINEATAVWLRETYKNNYIETNSEEYVEYIGFDENRFKLRADIIEYGKNMVKDDLTYGYSGDLSVRFNKDEMLISPSSMDYFNIKVEDIVYMNINTLDYGNQRVPSSDAEIHAAMYRELPGCNAIIHTHSNACSIFAACEAGFGMTDPGMKQLIGDIRVAKPSTGDPEADRNGLISLLKTTHSVILPHHGALFYGPSLEVVYEIAKSVELMARNLLQMDAKHDDDDE